MRDVTEAHFLHERHGLEAVLRPPVHNPTAMAWIPRREELLVATREGLLYSVDPVMGIRTLREDMGEAAVLSLHPDRERYLVVGRDGSWHVARLGGGVEASGKHAFLGGMEGFFLGDFAVMLGDEVEGRRMIVALGSEVKARPRIPARVVALPGDGNQLLLARATAAGLEVIRYGKGARFSSVPETQHRLRTAGQHVLGLTGTGVAVWGRDGGYPCTMRLPELTAGDISSDGNWLALGTRSGGVALARLDEPGKRAHPDLVKAFEQPVTTVAFASRGRWIATGADVLQLWSWED